MSGDRSLPFLPHRSTPAPFQVLDFFIGRLLRDFLPGQVRSDYAISTLPRTPAADTLAAFRRASQRT